MKRWLRGWVIASFVAPFVHVTNYLLMVTLRERES